MSPAPVDLVATHTHQIAALARIWGAALPLPAAVEDLEQVGWLALLRCRARYDPERGSLATYAHWRIRGAMQDELLRLDPRTLYAQRHGVAPVELLPVQDTLQQSTPAATPDPFLAAAVATLPARWQQVLRLSVVEGWRLHEIGALLGCGESRVSQMRTQALARLRTHLEASA